MEHIDNQPRTPPLFRLAFRPFFLAGAAFSAIAMAWWIWLWLNPMPWTPYGGPIWWHAHEMIFGFAVAIVVGFLLTAVQTWTNVPGLKGIPLLLLFTLWLTGRLLLAADLALPPLLIAVVDVCFLLCAAIAMAYPVLRVKQWRNLIFVPILIILALLNATSHWGILKLENTTAMRAMHGAVMLITLMVAIIGGRVIPMFTANGTGTQKVLPIKWLEAASLISLVIVTLASFIGYNTLPPLVFTLLFSITALFNSWRFIRWGFWRCWRAPLLWSLHLSYAFLPLGLIAMALYSAGWLPNGSAALHSFSTGAIGGMILAMIARVSLGHTGRALQPPALMTIAFTLIILAAAIRVLIPGYFPALYGWGIGIAGISWVIAYVLFCYCYGAMLCSPRADGKPG